MRKVYFIRHGEYDSNYTELPGRLPVPLSDLGREQARRFKDYFIDKEVEKIYSSPVVRCKQTAAVISDSNLLIEFDVRLADTLTAYQGYWGKNYEGKENHFFKHVNDLGGETLEDVQKRMMNFYEDKILDTDGDIVVCSHSDPIMTLRCGVEKTALPKAKVRRSKGLKLELGAVLTLNWDDEGEKQFDETVSLLDENND